MIPKSLLRPSPEQLSFLLHSTARQNWAHGPVRSGKNHVINIRFTEALGSNPRGNEDSDVYFGGKTKDTVERIFLRDLFSWLGEGNYTYNRNKGKGTISLKWPSGGRFIREFYCFGYADSDSHEAISGATIGLSYLTEGIYCHEDFHRQLVARLSIDEGLDRYSMLFGDTNPGSPLHWLWQNVINNSELLDSGDLRAFPFTFYSNPWLTEATREMLRRQYIPGSIWFKRMVQGLWAMAEGVIYADFFNEKLNMCTPAQLPKTFDELWASMDYGTTNVFVIGLWGRFRDRDYLIDAWEHDGAKRGHKTNGQYLAEIACFLGEYSLFYKMKIAELIIDPSAASFKADLDDTETDDVGHKAWRKLAIPVRDADNEVEPGIKTVSEAMFNSTLIICNRIKRAFDEIGTYAWDVKAQERGEDKPIKRNDHVLDMIRYSLHTRRSSYDPYAGWT